MSTHLHHPVLVSVPTTEFRRIAMLSLEALKRDWPGVGRSYFGETEESPLVSLNLGDPVLLRLLCGAVSPVEAIRFWAPVSDFLDKFIFNRLSAVPEAPKETLKIC